MAVSCLRKSLGREMYEGGRGSSLSADDEARQELVGERVEVLTVEFSV